MKSAYAELIRLASSETHRRLLPLLRRGLVQGYELALCLAVGPEVTEALFTVLFDIVIMS